MARPFLIPPKLHPEIMQWLDDGLSGQGIADRLLSDYGIKCSAACVLDLINKTRKERGEIAKAVLRRKLAGSLLRDLYRLECQKKVLLKQIKLNAGDAKLQATLIDTLRKLTETTLKYSGADEVDSQPLQCQIYLPEESDD